MIKSVSIPVLTIALVAAAHADFSYSTTQKMTGGMLASMAAAAVPTTSRVFLKGQKMKMETGDASIIMDFDAQTITTINNKQKTYTVKSFNDISGVKINDADFKIDAKETGQKKTVNGFNASEMVMTMEMEMPQTGKMQMDMDMWVSPEVPGVQELRAFYDRNRDRFPWGAMAGGAGNPGMQKAMAEVQRKMASLNGVAVEQVIKVKAPAGGMPGMAGRGPTAAQTQQMQAGMSQACAQMEKMKSQGGPAAAMIEQQFAKMCGGAAGGAVPGSGTPAASAALMEMTMTSSDFSTSPVPDSAFSIPAGFNKAN